MSDYIVVKKSQISLYKNIPFYYLSNKGEGVLFKKPGVFLTKSQIFEARDIEIFIRSEDKDDAVKELLASLNMELVQKIASKGIKAVRVVLCDIIEEALTGSLDTSAQTLPETIETIFSGYLKNSELFESLIRISTNSHTIIEHSVNVLSLTMLYCCFHEIPLEKTKNLCIAAILHDIGTKSFDKSILNTKNKLSDKEFELYKTHPFKGHDIIKTTTRFDNIIARVALEHHERLDGSGYPRGITDIAFESQLIGLIDSYESLTYRDKAFRKSKKPYESLKLLKEELAYKKFNQDIFKNLCVCLVK